jgi:ATP-dependent Clp protease ATP-binding subunit ClpA
LKNQESIGFVGGVATAADKEEAVYRQAIRELKKYVEPEFLGRIGKDIVVFKPFTREQLAEIAHREIVEFVNHLKRTFSVKLFISAQAKEFILNQSLDHPEYGARLIADKVEKYLIIPVARMINSGQIEKNDKVFVKWEDGELVFLKNSK